MNIMARASLFLRKFVLGSHAPYSELSTLGKLNRLIWLSGKRFAVDQHSQRAVALTYYTLFAIVPVAALCFGIAKGFSLQDRFESVLEEKLANHREVFNWITQFADTTLEQAQGGVVAGAGVIVLIWTVMWLATNIEKAFNSIWNLPPRRNLFRRLSDYLSILVVTPILLVVLSSAGPVLRKTLDEILQRLPLLHSEGVQLVAFSVEFFPVVMVCAIFTLIYFLVPNTKVRIGSALLAGVTAGLLFQLLQDGFLFLQGHLFRYNKIYGSFAVLPLFLIWLQWSWQIALFGAELAFVHQRIGTGLFENNDRLELSLQLRREYQLAILRQVYSEFEAGRGAVPENLLQSALEMPQVLLENLLRELIDAGLLHPVEDNEPRISYAPSLPPDRLTVADVYDRLAEQGRIQADDTQHAVLDGVVRTAAALREACHNHPANRLVKDL